METPPPHPFFFVGLFVFLLLFHSFFLQCELLRSTPVLSTGSGQEDGQRRRRGQQEGGEGQGKGRWQGKQGWPGVGTHPGCESCAVTDENKTHLFFKSDVWTDEVEPILPEVLCQNGWNVLPSLQQVLSLNRSEKCNHLLGQFSSCNQVQMKFKPFLFVSHWERVCVCVCCCRKTLKLSVVLFSKSLVIKTR